MNCKISGVLAAMALASFFGASASADFIYQNTFDVNNGGLTVVSGGGVESPWQYNGGAGSWRVNGSTNLGSPSFSGLRSPAAVVGNTGPVDLYLTHRYSFEQDSVIWDGGQVRVSINGGSYVPVASGAFTDNGYGGVVAGNNALTGQEAFIGNSPDYPNNSFIVSHAELGNLAAGTTVSVEFFGAWDEFAQGQLPNWELTDLRITDTLVPEPSTAALAIVGAAAGLIARGRRQAAKRA
jgi:hypothetical protein